MSFQVALVPRAMGTKWTHELRLFAAAVNFVVVQRGGPGIRLPTFACEHRLLPYKQKHESYFQWPENVVLFYDNTFN